jgi:hypothetical protein
LIDDARIETDRGLCRWRRWCLSRGDRRLQRSDLEHFDFLYSETSPTREQSLPIDPALIRVAIALPIEEGEIRGFGDAVRAGVEVSETWAVVGIAAELVLASNESPPDHCG